MMDIDRKTLYCDKEDISRLFPKRHERMNKGDAGRVLCLCGSYNSSGAGMCGAAYFAAMAAYRCGAGIVEIFTARENYASLASLVPEAVFSLYGEEENNDFVADRLKTSIVKADSIIIGCGLGKSLKAEALVKTTFSSAKRPMVIDADALNILSENESFWKLLSDEQRARTVITPHPGEMSRLCGKSIDEILNNTCKIAQSFSRDRGVVCLLKDHKTVICRGERTFINTSGNAGMATGGAGDVLAGIIGALLARDDMAEPADTEKTAFDSILYRAAVGAYIHGLAGDAAASKLGEYYMVAGDILHEISGVLKQNEC